VGQRHARVGLGWGWLAITVSMILFWALVIAGVAALVRCVRLPNSGSSRQTPEELLAERYARGEIDETQYRGALDNLKAAGSGRDSTAQR